METKDTRQAARELLLKARIYRFLAIFFALAGLAVFVVLYLRHVEGDIRAALGSPSFIVMILVPFLPAVVLSWMSRKAETELHKTLDAGKREADKK